MMQSLGCYIARGQRDQKLSLNKIKVEVELDKLYWKSLQDYKHS
jgi:hypothetical protein